jgi:Flp pilus assembly protein TadG
MAAKTYSVSRKKTKGVAILWLAMTLLVLLLFMGLTIDGARVYFSAHQLQNAADAGALAGAQLVKYDQSGAINRAVEIAGGNYAQTLPVVVSPDGEVILGRWVQQERKFYPTTLSPNAVKVWGNRPGLMGAAAPAVPLVFGPIAKVNTANVSRYATAVSAGSINSGLHVDSNDPGSLPGWHHPTGLVMNGGSTLDLRGINAETGEPMIGDVQINSPSTESPWDGFRVDGGSADIYAGEFNVAGTSNPDADDTGAWQSLYGDPSLPFSVNPYSPPKPDPLASLIPPDISTMPIGTDTTGETYSTPSDVVYGNNLTLNPGYYPGGISTSGSITLNPGVYAFGGGTDGKSGLVLGGNYTLIGNGVMIYITGDPAGTVTGTMTEYGKIDIQGTGTLDIISRGDAMDPPEINGEMGVAIWQDRQNLSYGKIDGNANTIINGVIYCVSNAMKLSGNPEQMGNQIIVGALEIDGNISLGIAYDGRNNVEARFSYLVE